MNTGGAEKFVTDLDTVNDFESALWIKLPNVSRM
jgi:hypothetical protein